MTAGEESELLVGMKNEGNHVLSVVVFFFFTGALAFDITIIEKLF